MISWGLRMQLFSENNDFKRHLPYSQVYRVTYNPFRVTLLSFVPKQRRKLISQNTACVTEFTEAMSKICR